MFLKLSFSIKHFIEIIKLLIETKLEIKKKNLFKFYSRLFRLCNLNYNNMTSISNPFKLYRHYKLGCPLKGVLSIFEQNQLYFL